MSDDTKTNETTGSKAPSTTRQTTLSREHQGPRAVLNAVERLANAYGAECDRVRQDLSIAEAQLRDYQARLGKPFLHDAYLSELTSVRDQLKAGLTATAHVQGDEGKPTVSELAERIKTLKAAHSIEATPQRARQKHSSAEEPITARIRRRSEAVPASDPAIRPDAAASDAATSLPPESTAQAIPENRTPPETPSDHTGKTQDSSNQPQMTFQERIAMERRRTEREPSLF